MSGSRTSSPAEHTYRTISSRPEHRPQRRTTDGCLADVGEAGEAYDARICDILVSDDRVLIVTEVTARRHGRQVDTQECMLARIEDGKIAEVWTFALDPAAFVGFWEAAQEVG